MAKKNKAKGSKDNLLKLFSNIDWKKFLVTSIVVFIAIYLLDLLINTKLMMAEYVKNAKLFLPYKVMMARMSYQIVGQVLYALLIVLLYSQGYSGKGSVMEGIRFGIYLGLFMQLPAAFMMYVTCPYPISLLQGWAIYGFIQTVIYGGIIGAMYKK